jgi:hypothetical protein
MSDAEIIANDYEAVPALDAGRRLGVQWDPWMGDWFTSWSPRNSNSHAEGPWAQWIDLAIAILQDPMTAKARPDAHAMVASSTTGEYDTDCALSNEDLIARFGEKFRVGADHA